MKVLQQQSPCCQDVTGSISPHLMEAYNWRRNSQLDPIISSSRVVGLSSIPHTSLMGPRRRLWFPECLQWSIQPELELFVDRILTTGD